MTLGKMDIKETQEFIGEHWTPKISKKPTEAEKEYIRKRNLAKRYGLTPDCYERLLDENNGCCHICGIDEFLLRNRLGIDHCHSTGRVRGLLCDSCNVGLSRFRDDITNLQSAIRYLSK